MNTGFIMQFAASLAAIGTLVALVAWARIARPTPWLDEGRARALLAEDFPGRPIDRLWIADDGAGAIARCGSGAAAAALVLVRVGDGYAARSLPWADAVATSLRNGRLSLRLGEAGAPRADLVLGAWPPKDIAA